MGNTTILTDSRGYAIGRSDETDSEILLYDINNHYLGKYDKRSAETIDANNHFVGHGNLLGMLLPPLPR